jgi:hypothetical protein
MLDQEEPTFSPLIADFPLGTTGQFPCPKQGFSNPLKGH